MKVSIYDILVLAMLVGACGMGVSVLRRVRAGKIDAPQCPECGARISRAYSACKRCGHPVE